MPSRDTKQWRIDFPEEHRKQAREYAYSRRRKLGIKKRGPRGPYTGTKEAKIADKLRREKLEAIAEAATKARDAGYKVRMK